jgi:hypothetical protein
MGLASTLLGAVRFIISRAGRGRVTAWRGVAAAGAMSASGRHGSNQRSRAFSGQQAESLAAAIEVEILWKSWRGRHQAPEQET